ncbi:MAG: hypothetical protein EOP45_19755 [Sphingobacteriaceae bacterium]|nr:MAG: hypothetical protein EOP45_19755 [Sphingobacteriaceae bacterium]
MKLLLFVIAFLTLTILISSCRKDKDPLFDGVTCSGNCYILTGKLIDSAVNRGIASGEVKFYFNDITGTFSNKKYYLGKAVTGVNGDYIFKFDGSRFNKVRGYYYAEAFKGNMFADLSYPNRVATFDLDTSIYGLPFIQNFPLFRPATIRVRVIVTSTTNFQFLTISYTYGKVGNGIVFNGGRKIDTTITWKTAGDLRTFVQSDAVGNGINIQKRDSIVITTNSTGQIEIRL